MTAKAPIVGVMGGASVSSEALQKAERLGELIADQGWVLLNGGRNTGIMEASAKGARARGGLTVGILPDDDDGQVSEFIDIPILTGMGSARNAVNVLSSRVVVACQGGAGTISEIALALKAGRPVVLLGWAADGLFGDAEKGGRLFREGEPESAVARVGALLKTGSST